MRRIFLSAEIFRSKRRRTALIAFVGGLLLVAATSWWLAGSTEEKTATAAVSAPASALPTSARHAKAGTRRAQAGVQGPSDSLPASEHAFGREEHSAVDGEVEKPQAFEPPLLSNNTNLSHARRGGLHRAANPLLLTASAVMLADPETGQVFYARNDRAILPIASLTKLLTGIIVLESRVPLNAGIQITREDVDRLRNSRSRLREGTTLTRREALRLALMSSENRAAHALARTSPGGTEAFVAAMNAKARALGMHHSTFVDPTGLSNGNRATARDVVSLVAAASRYPLLRSYSTTSQRVLTLGHRKLRYLNSNRLVRAGWPIQLQKTGYIVEAGQCVAMAMRTRGRELVMVLLDSGSRGARQQDAQRLRRWFARQNIK